MTLIPGPWLIYMYMTYAPFIGNGNDNMYDMKDEHDDDGDDDDTFMMVMKMSLNSIKYLLLQLLVQSTSYLN